MRKFAHDKDPLKAITQEQWADMWTRLRLHTWKRYFWLHNRLGEDLDELVHQAIHDTMSGVRRWPPVDSVTDKPCHNVSLFFFLTEVVRSNVSHVWQREKRRISIDGGVGRKFDYSADEIDSFLNASKVKDPDSIRSNQTESVAAYKEITERMLEAVAHDGELYRITKLWREQPDLRPSDLAEYLNFTMPQVRAAQKRLRRILRNIREVRA